MGAFILFNLYNLVIFRSIQTKQQKKFSNSCLKTSRRDFCYRYSQQDLVPHTDSDLPHMSKKKEKKRWRWNALKKKRFAFISSHMKPHLKWNTHQTWQYNFLWPSACSLVCLLSILQLKWTMIVKWEIVLINHLRYYNLIYSCMLNEKERFQIPPRTSCKDLSSLAVPTKLDTHVWLFDLSMWRRRWRCIQSSILKKEEGSSHLLFETHTYIPYMTI